MLISASVFIPHFKTNLSFDRIMDHEIHYHSRLSMALDDLLRCKAYGQQMLKLPIGESFSAERTIYESLFVALIVSYGRTFTSSKTTNESYKNIVSNQFGNFRAQVIDDLDINYRNLHNRIMEKRHTAIAHSDASSRNYQHFGDGIIVIGRNPYYPYEHDEVEKTLELLDILIDKVATKQIEINGFIFINNLHT